VQRLLAIVVACAFAFVIGQVPALHTHVYSGHEHREHDHGPAAHEHLTPAHHDNDDDGDAVHLDRCDPGEHAVAFTIGGAPLPQVKTVHAESATLWFHAPLVLLRSARSLADVRVHGPPPERHLPPRAPPLTSPA
jgi:hypothetical protein